MENVFFFQVHGQDAASAAAAAMALGATPEQAAQIAAAQVCEEMKKIKSEIVDKLNKNVSSPVQGASPEEVAQIQVNLKKRGGAKKGLAKEGEEQTGPGKQQARKSI